MAQDDEVLIGCVRPQSSYVQVRTTKSRLLQLLVLLMLVIFYDAVSATGSARTSNLFRRRLLLLLLDAGSPHSADHCHHRITVADADGRALQRHRGWSVSESACCQRWTRRRTVADRANGLLRGWSEIHADMISLILLVNCTGTWQPRLHTAIFNTY